MASSKAIIIVVFLSFLALCSSREHNVQKLFTKIVKSLPDAEKNGLPNMNQSSSIDPSNFQLMGAISMDVGPSPYDFQVLTFSDIVLSGPSSFRPRQIGVFQDFFNFTFVQFVADGNSRVELNGNYYISGTFNGTDLKEEGQIQISTDRVTRFQEHRFILSSDWNYKKSASPLTKIELVKPRINMTNLSNRMKEFVQTRNLEYATRILNYSVEYFFVALEDELMLKLANKNMLL